MEASQVAEAPTTAAQIRELEASLGQEVDAWMPEAGETLAGTVVDVEVRSSQFGKYPAVTVQRLDGTKLVFHAFRTVALNEVLRRKPKVGDVIAIAYFGVTKGTDYHQYKLRIGRANSEDFDWSQFGEKKRPGLED